MTHHLVITAYRDHDFCGGQTSGGVKKHLLRFCEKKKHTLLGGWALPLWKIWVGQLELWHSQYDGKNNPFMFQTTNQHTCYLLLVTYPHILHFTGFRTSSKHPASASGTPLPFTKARHQDACNGRSQPFLKGRPFWRSQPGWGPRRRSLSVEI